MCLELKICSKCGLQMRVLAQVYLRNDGSQDRAPTTWICINGHKEHTDYDLLNFEN